ncbi:hypothetical protein GCM10027592_60230 [Spirosoma flavus]
MLLLINLLTLAGSCAFSTDTLPTQPDSTKTTFRTERKPGQSYMIHQVSHISEFVRRFNGEQPKLIRAGEDSIQLAAESREQKVARLFDHNNVASSSKNSLIQKRKSLFLEAVSRTDQPMLLTFPTTNMLATVGMDVNYGGVQQNVKFFLKATEKDSAYSWKIVAVSVPFAMPPRTKPSGKPGADSTQVFIPLNAQETSFLALFNLIRDRQNLLPLAARSASNDSKLLQLSQLVQQGKIQPTRTEQPVVWLQSGDAWLMQLEYRNRENLNSGWLITDLFWLPGGDAVQLPKEFSNCLPTQKP